MSQGKDSEMELNMGCTFHICNYFQRQGTREILLYTSI